jgi:tRNA(adenine34) deaminase
MLFSHEYFMKLALLQAQNAYDADEVPVGAVVVCDGQIIAKAYNQVETLQDVTAHAEILAITAATQYLGAKYLNDCILYITLEPCLMCAGALYWSQIGGIVYGASDDKRGFSEQAKNVLHPKTQVVQGILERDCATILTDFFRRKRKFK